MVVETEEFLEEKPLTYEEQKELLDIFKSHLRFGRNKGSITMFAVYNYGKFAEPENYQKLRRFLEDER